MEGRLETRVLGELEVLHDGHRLPLPPSRKTRALLAYLALVKRSHRRDRLSAMFWDVADDARAALRWSLTKIRPVVNVGGVERLESSRSHVELRAATVDVDLSRVREAIQPGVATLSTAQLSELAGLFRGELLEGLFLPDFDDFEAWLEAERAEAKGMRVRILRELTERLADDPERALVHARAWLLATGSAEARQRVEALSASLGAPSSRLVEPPSSLSPMSLRRATTPFCAREQELARLVALGEEIRAGAGPRLVVVQGEPGQGKTRLLVELAQRERERACILHGECHEAERSRSYGPIIDALRRHDERLLADAGAEVLEALRSPGAQGVADTDALFSGFAALLRRLGERAGLCLVVIDDAHLADESSAEILHYAVRASAGAPLLVVVGCRSPDLFDNTALRRCLRGLELRGVTIDLRLEPLSEDQTRALVEVAAPGADAREIARRSAGNPFFALELARANSETIPPSLSHAIRRRHESLGADAQALVRWAAILDRAQLAHLEAVAAADVGDFVSAVEEAERYGFVHVASDGHGNRVAMAHDLLRQVVEEGLSTVRRAAMHRAVANHLSELSTRAELAPVIAHHAVLADNPSLAVRACREAAERSAAWKGAREAEELVELGLRHAEKLPAPERQERQIELLQVLVRVRRPRDVDALVQRLMTLGTEAMDHGRASAGQRAFHLVGYLRWDHDDPWRAHQGVLQAMQVSRENTADRALGLASSAMCLALLEQDLPRADALLVEAEVEARALPRPLKETALARALLYRHRGELERAREAFAEARAIARAAGDRPSEARTLEHELLLELEADRVDAARAHARDLANLCPHIREGGEGPLAAAMLAVIDGDDPREAVAPALAELRRLDDKRRLAIVLNRLAQRELAAGDLTEARAHAEEALALALRMRRPSEAAIAAALRLTAAARKGDDDAYASAEQQLTELETEYSLSAEARAQIERATLATSEGDARWNS